MKYTWFYLRKKYNVSHNENNESMEKYMYDSFIEIDKNLEESVQDWQEKYDKQQIQTSFGDMVISLFLMMNIVLSIYLLFLSNYYIVYCIMASLIYGISSIFEKSLIINN